MRIKDERIRESIGLTNGAICATVARRYQMKPYHRVSV